ncbi:MAG: hypothetical protein WC859_01995 [Elusimicrobiota bacterium]|jgi:hypothetical protein
MLADIPQRTLAARAETASGFSRLLTRLHRRLNAIRSLCPDLPVLAIFWLHLKHPLHPVQEELLALLKAPGVRPKRNWILTLTRLTADWFVAGTRCKLYAMALTWRICRIRWAFRKERHALAKQSFPVIAKTWGFSFDLAKKEIDFYFGDLQARLRQRGISMLMLCGNAGILDSLSFGKAYTSTAFPFRLPELCLLRVWDPWHMFFRQLIAAWKLWRPALRAADPVLRRALVLAARDVLAPQTLRDALFFSIAQTACRQWKPKAFLTLYEGHAWEKCAWAGAKSGFSSTCTAGYQHTVLFQESLAMTQPYIDSPERSLPDLVLGIGDVPLDLLRPSHEPHGCRLVRLGSFRFQKGQSSEPASPARRRILVTPEGMLPEMKALFGFTYRAARSIPWATFVIRTHPAMPLKHVLPELPEDFLRLPNIAVTQEKDISADFRRSSCILYRGSSTVLYAIFEGLRPVCLSVPGMIDTDPLYDLQSWREHCVTPEALAELLKQDEGLAPEDRQAQWREAADYVARYTMPVDDSTIDRMLEAAGLSERVPS